MASDVRDLLSIYLDDHYAGSSGGVALARRIVKENRGNDYGRAVAPVAREIEEDQASLRRIMERAGAEPSRLKSGLARVAERVGRLKLNGSLRGYSPLSRLVELEGLAIGVTGKLQLWRSLLRAGSNGSGPVAGEEELRRLISRAESQREVLEGLHDQAAREALRS